MEIIEPFVFYFLAIAMVWVATSALIQKEYFLFAAALVAAVVALMGVYKTVDASTLTTSVSVRISDEPVVIEPATFSTSVGASVPLHHLNQISTRDHLAGNQ
jgi:hypothetical protein